MAQKKYNAICMEKKNNGEKIKEMSELEVSSDENSTSSDVENEILKDLEDKIKCLKPYQFETEKKAITSVADTDKSEEECSEESDKKCHSHSTKKSVSEMVLEKKEMYCFCCPEVTALNEKFDKFLPKSLTEAKEFQILCINKPVLENILTGLHDSRGDYLEKDTTDRSHCYATYKQFTWWVYKWLGKGNRRVIPSCALWAIQTMYPELDNNYVLYNEGEKDWK